jgi:uncharacterized protein YebE (UPF0316 family)
MEFDWWSWVIIPVLIFAARLLDVSLATMRHILIFRGHRRIVPAIAFVEVLVWLVAITQVMNNLSNFASYLAWAGGFSAGTWLGMVIEEKIALGHLIIRIITEKQKPSILKELREAGFGSTSLDAHGSMGPVNIMFIVVSRKELQRLLELITRQLPGCFYTIEDVRFVNPTLISRGRPPEIPTPAPEVTNDEIHEQRHTVPRTK